MTILPFGQTVLLWRRARGLTQAECAKRAGISRPNLSAMERGRREVSLGTLRALAAGLDVRPGVLVDGISPLAQEARAVRLSRSALERIADAAARDLRLRHPGERALAAALRQVVTQRGAASAGRRRAVPRRGIRTMQAAWLLLESAYPPHVIQSLMQRVAERQGKAHASAAD